MIAHIVMIKFKEDAPEDVGEKIIAQLMELPALIPQIKAYECGTNVLPSDRAYDAALYSKFDSLEDLEIYNKNEDHQKVVGYIRSVAASIIACDYEIT